ncbi:tyrosine-protein phosphatase non-receptor type 13-like [Prorops nasuta]|uniref:tyrosine-protein phosphatase non-receptor type 13-like n=1 Tax=Prorops nasuta TaxID=863751 RepID=UPI0034CD12C5
MPTESIGDVGLAVVAGDILALRGTGLAAAETWALLCQAAQALQDLFLSNGGVVGVSRVGPVVTPHTLELTPRGRVLLQQAPAESARAYLPPEYRPGRLYSDTDSEKMWMYSLGRALLDTTPRIAALTGTVSVSPSSALQSVLAAMTEPDPRRRATLMNLLDVISEYCRSRLQAKPFTHTVMDMYREVVRSPQYNARKREAYRRLNSQQASTIKPANRIPQKHHFQEHLQQQNYARIEQQRSVCQTQQPQCHFQLQGQTKSNQQATLKNSLLQNGYRQVGVDQKSLHNYRSKIEQKQPIQYHQLKVLDHLQQERKAHRGHHNHQGAALFKKQSRNSQSHPNLTSLYDQQCPPSEHILTNRKPTFQSQIDIQQANSAIQPQQQHYYHARTNSQPVYTQQAKSSGNLSVAAADGDPRNFRNDPIYALPMKPFLSSQDVRANGLSAKSTGIHRKNDANAPRHRANSGYSHPDIASHLNGRREDICTRLEDRSNPTLQRQHSSPQLSNRELQSDAGHLSQPNIVGEQRCTRVKNEQNFQQQNQLSSARVRAVQGPPKPPRIITSLRKAMSDTEAHQDEKPIKPPRNLVRNGPRARRGKAVQRAPSRLYRAVGGPTRCFNKAQCVGPEFVVRANQPAKTLCVGSVKASNSGRIVVIMLTGQRIEVTCDPQKITAGDLFKAIVQAEELEENFTLGLAVLLAGDFAMLPADTKLHKVAPPGWLSCNKNKGLLGLPTSFMLYLRLRFFLPSLRGVRNWISKHLMYLQLRRCILEQQLMCSFPDLVNLIGLALQAEFGNHNANEHGCGDYFLLEHYIPESLILNVDQQSDNNSQVLRMKLHQAHRERYGLDSNKAEDMFVIHAQSLPDYGSHYYIATMETKELERAMMAQRKRKQENNTPCKGSENIYEIGKVEFSRWSSCETVNKSNADAENDGKSSKSDIYGTSNGKTSQTENLSNSGKRGGRLKKSESNVWLAIHAQGLKLFERGGEPRERLELAQFHWKDIQTLSYSKSCLVINSKLNHKRCKFKLRMDHRKSYFAFKLTSLHHQFYLRLRSEITCLQSLAKDFGVPIADPQNPKTPVQKSRTENKSRIPLANIIKSQQKSNYPMPLEEFQNKENEKPQKDGNILTKSGQPQGPVAYSSDEDALYARVNIRLEPEGESRDTEEEFERARVRDQIAQKTKQEYDDGKQFDYPQIETGVEYSYSLPKIISNEAKRINNDKCSNSGDIYAAINKVGLPAKNDYPVPEEVWNVADVQKTLNKMKTSSLPNYGTPRQANGFRTPSLPRRLGVKMGTRAIYSSLVQKDITLTDEAESVSIKSETESSIRSLSARSAESPGPEAYVLNADIRIEDETFHVSEDDSMSASLMARLEEISFAEERILQTIKLERGHGGSIGLQVTEGNDGGVYVQAVSVGGSADMTGNVNKGDRIVAINGQNLLNLRYEDALKMLQSSSETVELVLSQVDKSKSSVQNNGNGPVGNNYLQDIRFDVSSEMETSGMTNKWLGPKTTDVASVQNTSSAYSSAASSAIGNHNISNSYVSELFKANDVKSASMLLSLEDFDVSRESHQVFI